jgi:hypothetical protein
LYHVTKFTLSLQFFPLPGQLHLGVSPRDNLLLDLWTGALAPASSSPVEKKLLAEGLIELVDDSTGKDQTLHRHQRNPFEHLTKVIFEFTTLCNFNCAHCYNTRVSRLTEAKPELLAQAAKTFFQMGIRRFDFIGGEVSRYGDGWLELARQIRTRGDDIVISPYTNGWWLEQNHFQAAGKEYADTWEYLADLKVNGVSHVVFSLDGQGDLHDASRHHPGLYQRIMSGLAQVRQAGLEPRVSLLIRPENGVTHRWSSFWPNRPPSFITLTHPCQPPKALYDFRWTQPIQSAISSTLAMAPMMKPCNFQWRTAGTRCTAAIFID